MPFFNKRKQGLSRNNRFYEESRKYKSLEHHVFPELKEVLKKNLPQ
jgi:hypothetical protein